MSESFRRKEQEKHYWVPFREADIISSQRAEFGQVSWNPVFIPYGKQIQIDVAGVNRWLKSLNIAFPIEIKPYRPRNEDFQVSSMEVSKNGEAAISFSGFKSKLPKPKLALFIGDWETNTQAILINFSGIADYIKSQKTGISDKDFNSQYGRMVDIALKSQAIKLIIFNYLTTMKENPYMGTEAFSVLGSLFVSLATEVMAIASLAANGDLNIQTATASTMISGLLFLLTHTTLTFGTIIAEVGKKVDKKEMDKSLRRLYYEYLEKMNSDFPWKLVFPVQFNRFFSAPLISSFLKRTLIKRKE